MENYIWLKKKILVIDANIAVGKTTLTQSLSKFLSRQGLCVFLFPENIPQKLLQLYLTDKRKYAFSFQTIVANIRKGIIRESIKMVNRGQTVIIDRGLLGDYAFAYMQKKKGYFTPEEYETYLDLVKPECDLMCPEIYNIFLDCKPEIAFKRMLDRGIPAETKSYDLNYFKDLDQAHRVILKENVKRVNWDPPAKMTDKLVSDEICIQFLKDILG